ERHGNISTSQPERDGPIAGAKEITKPTVPIAVPRRSTGKIKIKIVIINGIITPAPDAWITLPVIKTGKLGENAQIIVPIANTDMALINNLRVENVSIKKAVTGIIIPFTNINIVVTHWAVFSVK